MNKDYSKELIQPGIGRYMLIAGIVLEVIGIFMIRKIVDIKY